MTSWSLLDPQVDRISGDVAERKRCARPGRRLRMRRGVAEALPFLPEDAAADARVSAGTEEVARGRYRAGVGIVTERLNVRSALTDARKQRVLAVSTWRIARLKLAASLGDSGPWNVDPQASRKSSPPPCPPRLRGKFREDVQPSSSAPDPARPRFGRLPDSGISAFPQREECPHDHEPPSLRRSDRVQSHTWLPPPGSGSTPLRSLVA